MWETRIDNTTDPSQNYRIYKMNEQDYMFLLYRDNTFSVTSKDGKRLLTPEIENELIKRNWKYYEDGTYWDIFSYLCT